MASRHRNERADKDTVDRLSIRIDFGFGVRIGPGKVAVLEAIEQAGSISGAGRALRMSYRRTWELVEDLNRNLGPVVDTAAGGAGGGGARLTPLGRAVVACYRAVEVDSAAAAENHLAALHSARAGADAMVKPGHAPSGKE